MRSTLLTRRFFLSCFLFWSCTKSGTDDNTPAPVTAGEFMKYTVNGTMAYELSVPVDTFSVYKPTSSDSYTISCKQVNNKSNIYMQVISNVKGVVDIYALYLTIGSKRYMQGSPGDNKVTITELGTATGEFIAGSFTGNFYEDGGSNEKITVTSSFRCKLTP